MVRAKENPGRAIAVVGPPDVGKTVLCNCLRALSYGVNGLTIFIPRVNPDNDGSPIMYHDYDFYKQTLRPEAEWTDELRAEVVRVVENSRKACDLIILPTGGRITDDLRQTLARCTHSVLLLPPTCPEDLGPRVAGVRAVRSRVRDHGGTSGSRG